MEDIEILKMIKGKIFATMLLLSTTIIEAFFAFKLFNLTGYNVFGDLTLPVSIFYAFVMGGIIVYFTFKNERTMVNFTVVFGMTMNCLLDVMSILLSKQDIENRVWVFASIFTISTILPIATKEFAKSLANKNTPDKKNNDEPQQEIKETYGANATKTIKRVKISRSKTD